MTVTNISDNQIVKKRFSKKQCIFLFVIVLGIGFSIVFYCQTQSLDHWYESHKKIEYDCKGGALQLSPNGISGCNGVFSTYWIYDDPRDYGISVNLPTCEEGYHVSFNDTNHKFFCYKEDPDIMWLTENTDVSIQRSKN